MPFVNGKVDYVVWFQFAVVLFKAPLIVMSLSRKYISTCNDQSSRYWWIFSEYPSGVSSPRELSNAHRVKHVWPIYAVHENAFQAYFRLPREIKLWVIAQQNCPKFLSHQTKTENSI